MSSSSQFWFQLHRKVSLHINNAGTLALVHNLYRSPLGQASLSLKAFDL